MKTMKISTCLCAIALQASITPAIAAESDVSYRSPWYLGAGLGITELDPDPNNTGYRVDDERDTGFKIFAGYDFSRSLSIEGFYSDLGSSKLSSPFPGQPDGEIDYSTYGASALWYLWRNSENTDDNTRKGLQLYVHGGLSFIDNASSLGYEQDNDVQIQYGAGIEYGLNRDIALRAGLDLYDKDAGLLFVGVLKRFGK